MITHTPTPGAPHCPECGADLDAEGRCALHYVPEWPPVLVLCRLGTLTRHQQAKRIPPIVHLREIRSPALTLCALPGGEVRSDVGPLDQLEVTCSNLRWALCRPCATVARRRARGVPATAERE